MSIEYRSGAMASYIPYSRHPVIRRRDEQATVRAEFGVQDRPRMTNHDRRLVANGSVPKVHVAVLFSDANNLLAVRTEPCAQRGCPATQYRQLPSRSGVPNSDGLIVRHRNNAHPFCIK